MQKLGTSIRVTKLKGYFQLKNFAYQKINWIILAIENFVKLKIYY